jgi:drug/metabolite transporter (DMT)-like permease
MIRSPPRAVLVQGGLHQGDALMLIAAAVYALYGVLLKRWSLPFPSGSRPICRRSARW